MLKKVLASIVVLVFAVIPCASASNVMFVIVSSDSELNVRERPDKDSSRIGYLDLGDEVNVESERHGWAKLNDLNFELNVGYVSSDYLSDSEPTIMNCKGYVVSNGRVALRDKPNGERKDWVNDGERLEIEFKVGNWYKVKDRGYVSSEFVEVIENE